MSSQDIQTILRQLHQNISQNNHQSSTTLLTRAKIALLHQNALIPTPQTPESLLQAAQQVLETGALISIRLQDPAAFTRYFQQLQPFYTLPSSSGKHSQRSKVTGLYLLLLLSQGDYAGFHTLLEGLDVAANQAQEEGKGKGLEEDEFVQYPIRLEQWLMEGSYDRVWDETKSERVPSEEFAIFSGVSRDRRVLVGSITATDMQQVLRGTIRSEVASCSEKAYPSIPVMNAKNLLFLDSEGSVVGFSQERGWSAKDGRIHFPATDEVLDENDVLAARREIIMNTLGYARVLETIV